MTTVALDACVLAPARLGDLLLRVAEEPRLYSPRWSSEILDEVRRTQVDTLGYPDHLADYWREQVTAAFPEALVPGYERRLAACQVEAGDRHLVASAVEAGAESIVTFNLRHFPPEALEPHGVTACHPADYLIGLCEAGPEQVIRRLADIAALRQMDAAEALQRLARSVPTFVAHVAERRGWPG